jgi:hypothetical protein
MISGTRLNWSALSIGCFSPKVARLWPGKSTCEMATSGAYNKVQLNSIKKEINMMSELEKEVKSSLVDDKLPCPVAFEIAGGLKVSPRQVGDMANKLKVRIVDCQLGCFQVKKATHDDIEDIPIKSTLAEEIDASLVNDYLPCAVALKVARKLEVIPKEIGDTATKQKIRIIGCQLGCFP